MRVDVSYPDADPPRTHAPLALELRFVYEDEHLAVIEKPPGLVVHPAPGHWDDTLVNALVAHGMRLGGGSPERLGIVHRLDRDTSGLMIIAKTDRAHRRLTRALATREIRRAYAVMAWGHLARAPETVDAAIARNPKDRKRMAVQDDGRPARTTFHRVARFRAVDLLRAELESGRTHQIRVHLAHIGHPVVGDQIYGGGGARRVSGPDRPHAEEIARRAPRQALHAAELGFTHPETGEALLLRSAWPEDLASALAVAAEDLDLLARRNPLEYLDFHAPHG